MSSMLIDEKVMVPRLTYSSDEQSPTLPPAYQQELDHQAVSQNTIGSVNLDFENLVEGVKGSK